MNKQDIEKIEKLLDLNLEDFISKHIFQDDKNINIILKNIQTELNLKNFPYKIICLDISHINWKNTSWWLTCLTWWFLNKKEYRYFKIPDSLSQDDYASLNYCLNKYFKKNTADLVILDGWKWQFNIVDKLDNNIVLNTDFISIWKWKARKRKWKLNWYEEIFFTINWEIKVDYNKFEHKLLLKVRDQAHNLSNRYRRIRTNLENKKLIWN